jgi:hypothetical protein
MKRALTFRGIPLDVWAAKTPREKAAALVATCAERLAVMRERTAVRRLRP